MINCCGLKWKKKGKKRKAENILACGTMYMYFKLFEIKMSKIRFRNE